MKTEELSAQERNLLTDASRYLPFQNKSGAWRRIKTLEDENKQILVLMRKLAEHYKTVVAEPRAIYLSIQQVRSGTVYIRWRKKGVRGNQKYLMFNSKEGEAFLLCQSVNVGQLYQHFNAQALGLNLAFSLRINETRRIKKYLADLV